MLNCGFALRFVLSKDSLTYVMRESGSTQSGLINFVTRRSGSKHRSFNLKEAVEVSRSRKKESSRLPKKKVVVAREKL
ncbi:hypothetical protein L1987_07846 [Smallanthus sonchifolius]|uniref:Uncharacterized protein n=1 Tax=Smallanthus sonchifolius TaxID=185202 RepID=A0ACB9JKR5_9ASTR|nr:hypothetical protein L1987_07846 [Smallanthus sonchifolius]